MEYPADIWNDDGDQEVDHDQTAPNDQADHQDHGKRSWVRIGFSWIVKVIKLQQDNEIVNR